MATKPVMLQSGALSREFWDQIQRRVAQGIHEFNTLAGESLWTISTTAGPIEQMVVTSATDPLDRLELSFDPTQGLLTCSPGPSIKAPTLHFHWRSDGLTHDDTLCSLDAALALILDELVAVDQD